MRTLCGMRLVPMYSPRADHSAEARSNSPSGASLLKSACRASRSFVADSNCSGGTPCSANNILPLLAKARTSMCKWFTSFIARKFLPRPDESSKLAICFNKCAITRLFPGHPMIPTATVVSESVKPACAARRARERSSRGTTAEMFRSEEPCAMAMTFTCARPSALKKRPLMFGRFFMPSPMAARMLQPGTVVTRISESVLSSTAKACSTLAAATGASPSSTATVIECSDEPWDVKITLTPVLARASIILRATPWVPRKDAPESVTNATFSIDVMALTGGLSSLSSSSWSSQRSQSSPRP
mmetsp:Transcript_40584/g.122585  ORF Transcript_40584/g.122585 Transcript_40584/m.122585 type:complete len:300 (-) Transcript_40584:1120-2019(-)